MLMPWPLTPLFLYWFPLQTPWLVLSFNSVFNMPESMQKKNSYYITVYIQYLWVHVHVHAYLNCQIQFWKVDLLMKLSESTRHLAPSPPPLSLSLSLSLWSIIINQSLILIVVSPLKKQINLFNEHIHYHWNIVWSQRTKIIFKKKLNVFRCTLIKVKHNFINQQILSNYHTTLNPLQSIKINSFFSK